MDPVIQVRDLTEKYKETLALDRVDFDIERNTIYGFLGRNGAGKTTAMSILTAQNFATSGSVRVFDEPYLGLDALARQIFYDRLIADYAEHPRTILLSSHLIDEISSLIERVLVIDKGRIIMDQSTDEARERATNLVGDATQVERFVADHEVIHRETLGRVASATFLGTLSPDELERVREAGHVHPQRQSDRPGHPHAVPQHPDLRLGPRSDPRGHHRDLLRHLRDDPGRRTQVGRWSPGPDVVLRDHRRPGAHTHLPVLPGHERHPAGIPSRDARRGRGQRDRHGDPVRPTGALEIATEGYCVNGYVAYLPWLWDGGPLAAWFTFFTIMMFAFVVGFWGATVFKRRGTMILTIVLLALGLVVAGTVLLTLYALILTAVLAAGSYLTLRRAVA